jgi:hypothetical protein
MPRKPRPLPPTALLGTWTGIAVASQAVIAMRLMGMAGLWRVPASENTVMVTEKLAAAFEAGGKAWGLALTGAAPAAVALAYARPVARVARANRKRLAQGNPLLPRV